MVERRRITTTPEMLAKMTLPEKVKQYAVDVMITENNPEYLKLDFQVVGGPTDGEHTATYVTGEDEFTYDFLFGFGSLGHPLRPSPMGQAVLKIAERVDTTVMILDFTYARFRKRINPEAIEEAFYPIWGKSEQMKGKT